MDPMKTQYFVKVCNLLRAFILVFFALIKMFLLLYTGKELCKNCTHECVHTITGPVCRCKDGFMLESSNNSCVGNVLFIL